MKFTKRLKKGLSIIFNKSTEASDAENFLLNVLGVDRNTKEDVLSDATYFACMKMLCESLGKLPLKLMRHTSQNGVETVRDHPLYFKMHDRPNPYMTSTIFWSTVEFNRNHFGNAYVWKQGFGESANYWILPTNDVEIWYDDAKILADQPDIYYIYSAGGKRYQFGSYEILHFKSSNTLDGIAGISVQKQLQSTIGGNVKSQKMLNKMYDSGFTAKAVLNYTGSFSDANVKELIKMTELYARGELSEEGIKNIIPIPLGFSLTPFNVKLGDNQFIEVRQYSALQIASAFGIKPSQIGDYTKSSYASAEAQQLSFYVDTLLYIVKQYEEELKYKLLTSEEIANGYHFKFNIDVILRADFATKVQTLSTAVNSFLMTPNEARNKLDLENKQGGDELLGNGASIPVQYTGSQYIKDPPVNPDDSNDDGKGGKDNG